MTQDSLLDTHPNEHIIVLLLGRTSEIKILKRQLMVNWSSSLVRLKVSPVMDRDVLMASLQPSDACLIS